MQRFIVPMEKSTRVERGPARQRHGGRQPAHLKKISFLFIYLTCIFLQARKEEVFDGPVLETGRARERPCLPMPPVSRAQRCTLLPAEALM